MKYLKLKNRIKELERFHSNSSWSKFKLGQENERLKEKIERLEKLNKDLVKEKAFLNLELEKKLKEPIEFNISMNKEDVDDVVKKVTENILGKQEKHECTEICFKKHVLDPIQADIYQKFGRTPEERAINVSDIIKFVDRWEFVVCKDYPFISRLYTHNYGTLVAEYK